MITPLVYLVVLLFPIVQPIQGQDLTLVETALSAREDAPLVDVFVHGDLAYVGGSSRGYFSPDNIGIRIVDLSLPDAPQVIGHIPLRPLGYAVDHSYGDAAVTSISSSTFEGDVAVVRTGVPYTYQPADYPQPFGIWDVTDPTNPIFLNILNFGNSVHAHEQGDLGDHPWRSYDVAGHHVFALYETGPRPFRNTRFGIADISDPRNPVIVGTWQDDSEVAMVSMSVNEAGTRVYINGLWPKPWGYSATHGYMYILDVSQPTEPVELGRYVYPLRDVISSPHVVEATNDDGLVVFADGSWQDMSCGILHILDTSNPAAIVKVSEIQHRFSNGDGCGDYIATDVAIRGTTLYSAWLKGGIRAFDISDPTNPVETGTFLSPYNYSPWLGDVALLGDHHIVTASIWWHSLFILTESTSATGNDDQSGLPAEYALHPSYPNPFNPQTNIRFDLPVASDVQLSVYDVQGRKVASLADTFLSAGSHEATWKADALPSGVYLVRLTTPAFTASQRLVLQK